MPLSCASCVRSRSVEQSHQGGDSLTTVGPQPFKGSEYNSGKLLRPLILGCDAAHNCRSETEVDAVLSHAVAQGATLKKSAEKVFWGGYSGYFADPDGQLWEVAYNPHFTFNDAGHLRLP